METDEKPQDTEVSDLTREIAIALQEIKDIRLGNIPPCTLKDI